MIAKPHVYSPTVIGSKSAEKQQICPKAVYFQVQQAFTDACCALDCYLGTFHSSCAIVSILAH